MNLQSNPYLVWQLIPGLILFWIGLYIQSRPVKKRESNVFSLLMFGGSLWAFANAVQLITPNMGWQRFWNDVTYLGIMVVPTAWFLLSVKLTGILRQQIEKVEKYFWIPPSLLYIVLLTSGWHHLFFNSVNSITVDGFVTLINNFGVLFYVHTVYSYLIMILGVIFMVYSLATKFRLYGVQVYGLIIGIIAPLIGNAYFLFGSPPPGFPDPTPIIFTVTGAAFAWAIFGGHILDVVPLAHEAIVRKLTTGVIVLDADKRILDINDAARTMLGLDSKSHTGVSLATLIEGNQDAALRVNQALDSATNEDRQIQIIIPETRRTFEVQISHINDNLENKAGWLIQFNDVSEEKQVKEDLAATQKIMRDVLDTLQDAYFEALPSGNFFYVNEAFSKFAGYPKDEIIGKHFSNLASRKSIRDTVDNFKVLYKTGKPMPPFEFIYRRSDGQEFVSEMVVSPIIRDDRVVGTRGIIRDISVRVEAEELLRQAKEAAESRAGELAAINRVSSTVIKSLDLKDVLQSVCRELTSIFEIRNAGIGLLTYDKKNLEIIAFHAIDPTETSVLGMVLPVEGNSSSMEVLEKKKTVIIQDATTDSRTSLIADISKSRGTRSIMIVPLLSRGEAIGTIGMPAKDPQHIFSPHEIQLAETIANQIASAVDNARLHSQTEKALGIAERDLEIGRQIQSGFFPETLPKVPGWEIATHFRAARQVAGDFYDVFQIKNSTFTAFIIADVCDKGVGAALFMVLFRSLLRAFSERQVSRENVQDQLLDIIMKTNNFIAEYHGKSNMFATIFFGILDPENGTLTYVNGGHEPPVILDKDGRITRRLMPTGPAVGMFSGMDFKVEQVVFAEGNTLVGFTDGTTDAKNGSGEQFTEKHLLKVIAVPWTSIFSMLFELNVELQRHIGNQSQFDDITLVALRRKSASESGHHAICRKADLKALGELREFVASAAQHCDLTAEDAFAFKLAADELCSNIIQYGYEGREPGWMSLSFDVDGSNARLIIRDNGTYFSPKEAQSPDVEADWESRRIGGLGIYFVKELMDNVVYSKADKDINQIVLEKQVGHTKTK